MRLRNWILAILVGGVVGAAAGFAQMSIFQKQTYVAKSEISELIMFDDFWDIAPTALRRAELLRPALSWRCQQCDERKITEKDIALTIINSWNRYLDDIIFEFTIDEAFLTSNPGGKIKRYAELKSGFHDGLDQRRISLHVAADSAEGATNAMRAWQTQIMLKSREKMRTSLSAWFDRKAEELLSVRDVDIPPIAAGFEMDTPEVVREFRQSAKTMENFNGWTAKISSDITVNPVVQHTNYRVLVWAIIGALLSLMISIVYKRASK
ncbi:hypothetical protein [uncultured Castellaniella sp.]|uniref:hypothetical protein n=1 Tax=uncultured Castellaniella sp. TaxID=647907 RepID=UPI002623D3E4|nr:hypothetical protein [uncultured Castellaniella sp.]